MIQYQKTNAAVERHKWEVTCQVIVNEAWMSVGKRAKAEHIRDGLIPIIANHVWTRNGRWHKVIKQGQQHWWGHDGQHQGNRRVGFGASAFDRMSRLFMWPFAVAGLKLRYFSINFLLRLGPLRKPFRTTLSNVKILGLHNDWCANFTQFAWVLTECVNVARFTPGWSCGHHHAWDNHT